MKTIAGIFDNQIIADKAVAELLSVGFTKDNISLIMTQQTKDRLFDSTDDEADRTAKGAIGGAVFGGVLGALLAGLTATGSIVGTGGAILLSGPLVALLSGAGAGGIAGGFAGALTKAGFAADEANRFEEEIKRGKAVIVVHADDDISAAKAKTALVQSGAVLKAA